LEDKKGAFILIRLHHILNPFDTGRQILARLCRSLAERRFRNVKRGCRNLCWCGGELLKFKWHRTYGVCQNCGCYVNRKPPLPEDLKKFYSLENYWGKWMQIKGVPTIDGRTEYDLKDGRVDYWLSLVNKYCPKSGDVIEIGCGHAVLLGKLQEIGYRCIGVEISEDVADWVRRNKKITTITGTFPHIQLPNCDIFLAMDVMEHVHAPVEFLLKVYESLKNGGVAILQQPTIRVEKGYDLNPPFGEKGRKMFDDLEHLWIFTSESLRLLAERTGMRILNNESRWRLAHEILVLKKD
jgi:SAM-dependent methyltransferase